MTVINCRFPKREHSYIVPSTCNESIDEWLNDMDPRIIKTAKQHREALAEIERLAAKDPAKGSPEGDKLELMAKLVEDYEKQKFVFARPDPLSAIRFRMEEQGLRQKDLAPLLGGKNRVSEVLSGKRALTLGMVRSLSEALRIPAELLVREPVVPYAVEASVAKLAGARKKAGVAKAR